MYFYNNGLWAMQYMKWNKNIKFFVNYFLGPLLFIVLSYVIYKEIKKQPNWEMVFLPLQTTTGIIYLLAVLVLMLCNWSIEAIKWKILVRPIQPVSLGNAFKATLAGVSFTLVAPNRMGEYLGRVMYMNDGNKLKAISMTVAGGISQLLVTLLLGSVGLIVLQVDIIQQQLVSYLWMQVLIWGTLLVTIALALFYFRLSWMVRLIKKIPGVQRFLYLIEPVQFLDATILLRLLSLSLLRFLVFTTQYYLMFCLFNVEVTVWQAFWAVCVSFLILAVVPSFAIAELAQRGFVIKTLVGIYSTNVLGMVTATTCIWVINLMLPAIAGSLLILSIKRIIKEKDEDV
jgi:hypothetical protein